MNYWLIIPVSLHPNTLCSVEMMELSAPPQTLVITCADSSVFVMVRTPDWFKNLRGRAEVTIASFSSRLQGFHHSHPNRKGFSNHANRQVGMESSRQAELAASGSFHDLLPPVGFACHKLFKLGIGDDWEDPFAGIGLETTADQDDLSWKPYSNLPPKKSQSPRTSLRIAALMVLKWMICC